MEAFLQMINAAFATTLFGMTAWHFVGGSLVIIACFVLRTVFAKTIIAYLSMLTKKSATDIDDKILFALKEPLKFVPIVLGVFFLTQWFVIPTGVENALVSLTQSLIAFTIFWAIYRVLTPLSAVLETILAQLTINSETLFAEEFSGIITKGSKIAIMFIGLTIVLSQWGVNVTALLSGLGILGMAAGLAAQDTIKNWFGGVKILADGQFKRGDWIMTPDIEGTVVEIGIATTRVREFDKAITSIPNSDLAGTTIKNYSKMTNRRVKMTLGLEYSSTANQLENVVDRIREYLHSNPEVAQPEEDPVVQMVHLVGFAGSSIDISLYYFTKTTKWAEWRRIIHENMIAFKKIVEDEGASFAFPSQSLYLESTPSEAKTVNEVERKKANDTDITTGAGAVEVDEDGDG